MAAAEKRTRVLIVDDSAFMRKVLEEIIRTDPKLEVVGQAKDGREALTMAQSLQPDVMTMDINMPRMDGLEATQHIMTQNPRPIVIVSSESRQGAASTLRALELGAIDFVTKPSSGIDLDMKNVRDELLCKLKMAAKVRVVRTATSLSGSLEHLDLPGIMQMLDQTRKTGALHVNAGETDAVLFFELGEIHHAECGKLISEEAVVQIVKDCQMSGIGVYKLVAGTIANQRTVHRRSMDLLLDALREFDEANQHPAEREVS